MVQSAEALRAKTPRSLIYLPGLVEAKSPLKWVGSKRQLEEIIVAHITKVYPDGIDKYYEPFCGGASIFFALRSRGLINGTAYLSDTNADLINLYTQIRDDVDGFCKAIQKLCKPEPDVDGIRYYEIRNSEPRTANGRAARMLYLNKSGYNGLYRVNKSGGFNVPWNRKEKPYVPEFLEIRRASLALQGVSLLACGFEDLWRNLNLTLANYEEERRFVYFDPPYIPASASADFTAYQLEGFGAKEHADLAAVAHNLSSLGFPFLLSNSDTPASRKLYKGLTIKKVQAVRNVNSDASKRGPVGELLVSNPKKK